MCIAESELARVTLTSESVQKLEGVEEQINMFSGDDEADDK